MLQRKLPMCVAFIAGISFPAFAATEDEFLSHAIKGDNSEVALGQLAVTKGASNTAKSFGQTLVDDHSKHRDQAAALAKKLGVPSPDGITDEARQEEAKLQKLTGAAFDREFAQYMAKDHEKDVSEFKQEASKGQGPVQQLASEDRKSVV